MVHLICEPHVCLLMWKCVKKKNLYYCICLFRKTFSSKDSICQALQSWNWLFDLRANIIINEERFGKIGVGDREEKKYVKEER